MFQFIATEDFIDELNALPTDIQHTVKKKLAYIAEYSDPFSIARKLKGYKNIYRFRVGDYRILTSIEKNTITFLNIGHRKDIYEGL